MAAPVAPQSPSPSLSSHTFVYQSSLPKLPIPSLEDTCSRYLRALSALQTPEEHRETQRVVQEFLEDPEQGPRIQKKLIEWAKTKDR